MIIKIKNTKSEKFTFLNSILSGNYNLYLQQKRRNRIKCWWIEIKNQNINRYITFDNWNQPINNFEKPEVDISSLNGEEIYLEIFEDIYRLMNIRDMEQLQETHSKYLNSWNKKLFITPPTFPVLSIDIDNLNDTIEKYSNPNDIIMNYNLNGYEWAESERIIDSLGQLYEVEYLNFGHPMGVVVPKRIERTMSTNEVNEIIKNQNIEFKVNKLKTN